MDDVQEFVEWLRWAFGRMVPWTAEEAWAELRELMRGRTWETVGAAFIALGAWKALDLVAWLLRRAWIPILAGLGLGAGLALARAVGA